MNTQERVKARIVSQKDDGTGVVEVPVAVVTPEYDRAKTSGGGTGKGSITLSDLQEMEANFVVWPQPVGVGVDSDGAAETDGVPTGHRLRRGGPQLGFVESVRLSGDRLWARIRIASAQLFAQIKSGMWGAFSMEASRNRQFPTTTIPGWGLSGGVFTNAPATPNLFAFLATDTAMLTTQLEIEGSAGADHVTPLNASQAKGAASMSDETISLASHEAKIQEKDRALALKTEENRSLATRVTGLEEENAALKAELSTEKASHSTIKSERDALKVIGQQQDTILASARKANAALQTKVNELQEQLSEQENAIAGDKVRQIVKDAIAAGVPPAVFDGHETDPASWCRSKFVSVEAFAEHTESLRGVSRSLKPTPAKSGHEPGKEKQPGEDVPSAVELTAEEQQVFDRLNLGTGDLAEALSEEEAEKIYKARKKTAA